VFNRSDLTELAVNNLRVVKPYYIYVSADGPREGHPTDSTNCQAVREVVKTIDWPCELKVRFLDHNQGCGRAVAGAIDWFFSNVEEGIILEDDTLPIPYFFLFAKEMLEKFRSDERVFMVSGTNMYPEVTKDLNFFFTRTPSAWGWATWRRAWNHYDYEMKNWTDNESRSKVRRKIHGRILRSYLTDCFDDVVNQKVDTWDYQWMFSSVSNSGMGVTSGANLVTNIGISGTHSKATTKSHFLSTSTDFALDDIKVSPRDVSPFERHDNRFLARRLLPLVIKRRLRALVKRTKPLPRGTSSKSSGLT
jgi:hypothetical protein